MPGNPDGVSTNSSVTCASCGPLDLPMALMMGAAQRRSPPATTSRELPSTYSPREQCSRLQYYSGRMCQRLGRRTDVVACDFPSPGDHIPRFIARSALGDRSMWGRISAQLGSTGPSAMSTHAVPSRSQANNSDRKAPSGLPYLVMRLPALGKQSSSALTPSCIRTPAQSARIRPSPAAHDASGSEMALRTDDN
jgi:hypothetical protein